MEQKTNDELMRNILIEEARKELSGDFSWSKTLLEIWKEMVEQQKKSLFCDIISKRLNSKRLWHIGKLQ